MSDPSFPRQLDRYELLEKIGSGGMGMIVKAFDTKLKRTVAIKMISERLKDENVRKNIRERFFNEARAAGGISHPNIVQVYDFGEVDNIVYIVMEYIEGETLEHFVRSKGPLNLERFIKVTQEIAAGLSFAHKKGIVHRDVKPSNIIMEANTGVSKILDFGIAKFVDEEEMKLTSTGMVLGSTHYLSPEHITGKNLDGRSDVFCLGTLLYEASTGVLPFRGNNSSTILYKIVHFDPPPPQEVRPELPAGVSAIIKKCLQKNPAERFQKCEDILEAISKLERSMMQSPDGDKTGTGGEAQLVLQSFFVRDSQLLTALVNARKLNNNEASALRGKAAYESILRSQSVSEDDLSSVISDCLQIPWIPRGRLKALRIQKDAVDLIPRGTMEKFSILPFYRDDAKKTLSIIIDGVTDFQREPRVSELSRNYHLQLYIGGRPTIQRLIQQQFGGAVEGEVLTTTGELESEVRDIDRRLLLVEPQKNYQQSVVSLFRGLENCLTIVSTLDEAIAKIKNEKFHHIWANRDVMGDELGFESVVIRTNPSCDIRFYKNLGEELLEDSVSYPKFRDLFHRMVQILIEKATPEEKKLLQTFSSMAVRVAKVETTNQKELDEVYYSSLFFKWERLRPHEKSPSDVLFGVYRLRHIKTCLGERFDGRGPLGIKQSQIPLASRVLATLSVFDKLNPQLQEWSEEVVTQLRTAYEGYAGKQLDPVLIAEVLDLIRPAGASEGKSCKVVLIDPDETFSAQMKAYLKNINADVTIFTDGAAALTQMKKNVPDLIVSEVLLQKLDGFSLAARLRADEVLKQVPFVFLSDSKRPEHSMKAIQLGAEDFISKSSEPSFIVAKLERFLKT